MILNLREDTTLVFGDVHVRSFKPFSLQERYHSFIHSIFIVHLKNKNVKFTCLKVI